MNRGLVYTLCAAALVAVGANSAQAATDLSLNLRYNDPADPTEGGAWTLVAKTDDADGIAAIRAIIDNVDNGIGPDDVTFVSGIGAIDPIDAGGPNERPAYLATASGVDLIYGQDLSTPASVVAGVGTGTSPSIIATDVLRNASWDGASAIAMGTFGGSRPAFVGGDGNELDGAGGADAATGFTTTVRGDSWVSLALESPSGAGINQGDANRDGFVNSTDLLAASPFFNIGPSAAGWDGGDWNDSGAVDSSDLLTASPFFNTGVAPPAPTVGAVPEPATIGLAFLSAIAVFAANRRR